MNHFIDFEKLEIFLRDIHTWAQANVLVITNLAQLFLIAVTFFIARAMTPVVRELINELVRSRDLEKSLTKVVSVFAVLTLPLIWLILQWMTGLIATAAQWPHQLLVVTVSLLTAWVIIRFTSSFVRNPLLSRLIAVSAWTLAALNILNLLGPAVELLESLAISFGEMRLSLLTAIKGAVSLALLLWFAVVLSSFVDNRLKGLPSLTPSAQVLFSKLFKIVVITIAIVVALNSVGIDLTAFAVFSGALGVGIGFGLQKIVANLISGIILLTDKSVKPGDVITIGETYGWINELGARYVSVVTRDGAEYLIPNEDLIVQQVVNWSFTDRLIRLKVPVGISYNSDVYKARELCVEAANECQRIVGEPPAICHLIAFGESSVDLELRFWIEDPEQGISNIKSDVMLKIWDKFHEGGIEIPYPQRDLHIKSSDISPAISPAISPKNPA